MASEESGILNVSLEVHPTLEEATSCFLPKGLLDTVCSQWPISPKELIFGENSCITMLPSAFPEKADREPLWGASQ